MPVVRELLDAEPVVTIESSIDLLREFERTGSAKPFEAFMRRHAAMVYATCLKVTRDPHDAEDATQATFLTLASKSRLNGEIRQPEAWLRKVAHRLALDLIRSKKRRINRENVRSEMTNEAAPLDSHDHADKGEVKRILNEELAKLPASYRMPLILHYFGGLSREEMADQLKLKPSTLGVRLHRAREQLRRRLAGRGIVLPGVAIGALMAETVRGAVCGHLMSSTAQQASAIALGHAAVPQMAATGVGLDPVGALLAALSHGKLKFMLSLLMLGSAISMTSAKVQEYLPAVVRKILPTLRLPSLPSLDFLAPAPLFTSVERESPPLTSMPDLSVVYASATELGSARAQLPRPVSAPVQTGSIGVASALKAKPLAIRTESADRAPVAAVHVEPLSPPLPPPSGRTRPSAAPIVFAAASVASTSTGTKAAPASTVTRAADAAEPVSAPRLRSPAPNSDSWNSVLASRGDDGPAVPGTANGEADAEAPEEVVASVVGAPPPLSGYYYSGGGGGGVATGASYDPDAKPSKPSRPSGTPRVNVKPPAGMTETRTVVFAGTSANYGGYADESWQPTELTDVTGSLIDPLASDDAGYSFDAGPAIPGAALSINGARLTLHGAADTGEVAVTFVDTSSTQIAALPQGHHFIGVWELAHHEPFSTADVLVRYDDLRAARLGLNESILKLWVSDGTTWSLMWLDPTFGRDIHQNLLWVTAPGDFRYFAVSAPEPAFAATLAGVLGALARRRRR